MGWFSKVGSFIKENAHTILDVAGMIPGVGAVADIANAALYAAEGDWANAAMSAVSAIPGIGDTVAMANKGVKAAKGVKTALKAGKSLKSLLKAGGKSIVKAIKGKAKAGAKALKNWKETLGSIFKKKKTGDKHVCTGDKCFTGDTLVYTEKGHIPIREIREGDKVYSRNEQTGEMGFKKIEQIFRTETHTIHSIEVNGNTVIRTTAYHRFYVEEKGWVNAINLQTGDFLITPEGQACITAVGKERFEEPVIMYNFHVEEWASYFVSELGLYVHNGIGDHDGIESIVYGELDLLGRPTGIEATITQDMIGTGSDALHSIKPPGFDGGSANHARGHLLGNQLGGSGKDKRNLVTLFQNPTNSPVMRGFENLVRKAVEGGEIVKYNVTALYKGKNLMPSGVTIKAIGDKGFNLFVTVLNKNK